MRWLLPFLLLFPSLAIAQPVSTVEADQTIELVKQGQIDLLRQELRTHRAAAIVNAENENHVTPLLAAIAADQFEIFEIFLNVGGNVKDHRPLIWAAQRGGKAFVDSLLTRGANPNAADPSGWTALHAACQAKSRSIVAALLAKGANPNAEAKPDNWRPIHEAIWQRSEEVLGVLLADKRTKADAVDGQGWTPLHLAVEAWIFDLYGADGAEIVNPIVRALTTAGGKMSAATPLGETPTSLLRVLANTGKLSAADALFAGDGLACVRAKAGGVACRGEVYGAAKAVGVLRLGYVEQLYAVHNRVCALSHGTSGSNAVRCWGHNPAGSLGVGNVLPQIDRPMLVPGLRDALSLAVGGDFSCVVLKDGSVRCWGGASAGIWMGAAPGKPGQPVTIAGLANAVAVAATDNSACVLDKPGRVRCWGHGALGQLGHGQLQDSAAPVEVKLPSPALALTAGSNHVCARLQNGRAVCWGSNERGQLGNGASVFEGRVQDAGDRSPLPVAVVGVSNLTQLVAGGSQTCAVSTGTKAGVFCWGGTANAEGEAEVTAAPRFLQAGPASSVALDSHGGWILGNNDWPLHFGMQPDGWQSKPIRWQ